MRKEISPNGILDINEGVIAHQVNCRGKIGTGVSKAIISKWPEVEVAYKHYCKDKNEDELFGRYQVIQISPKLSIVNIFSQKEYGNAQKTGKVYTDMTVLTGILKKLIHLNVDNVYVPDHIGCGLAGGNWSEFLSIMRHTDLYIREHASI